MGNVVASGIAHAPHLTAFDTAAQQRLDGIDLTPLLMYVIDTTHVDALPFLAEQFHVLGWEGWALTTNEAERRALIKKAIELHRYKGTIWAIKNALVAVGFDGAQVIEHIGLDYNAATSYDGTENYAGGEWATFRVKLQVPNDRAINASDLVAIFAMINEYKNARSHLIDVTFVVELETAVEYDDTIDLLAGGNDTDNLTAGLYYDGVGAFGGTYLFNKGDDPGTITITNGGVSVTENF